MDIIWGLIVLVVSLFGWFGQAITAFSPSTAVKYGLTEPEEDVDPAFYADVRGEAFWDTISTWPLPVAGLLLLMGEPAWAYFGLVGGGIYLYFAGRGIFTRRVMQKRGIRVGKPENLKVAYTALVVWGVVGAITIFMAAADLPLP
jgi:hypothetical protein